MFHTQVQTCPCSGYFMSASHGASTQRQPPLFLAFLNTVEDDGKTRRIDSFDRGQGLLDVLNSYGLADAVPIPGPSQMTALHSLREAGYAVLSAMAAGRRPGREESLYLEMAVKSALFDAQFQFTETGLRVKASPLGGLHDHLVLSLSRLLQSPDLTRLRECKRCTHLFLDHGRGQGRRWCSMARCGNRAKAESFRKRHHGDDSRPA